MLSFRGSGITLKQIHRFEVWGPRVQALDSLHVEYVHTTIVISGCCVRLGGETDFPLVTRRRFGLGSHHLDEVPESDGKPAVGGLLIIVVDGEGGGSGGLLLTHGDGEADGQLTLGGHLVTFSVLRGIRIRVEVGFIQHEYIEN